SGCPTGVRVTGPARPAESDNGSLAPAPRPQRAGPGTQRPCRTASVPGKGSGSAEQILPASRLQHPVRHPLQPLRVGDGREGWFRHGIGLAEALPTQAQECFLQRLGPALGPAFRPALGPALFDVPLCNRLSYSHVADDITVIV